MAISQITNVKDYIGLSTDTKPLDCGAGSTFYETDTSNAYIYNATWQLL